MRMMAVTLAGLALLFVFVLVSRIANRARGGAGGARMFIWIWMVIVGAYCAYGVTKGFSPLVEVGVFLVVFGVPAAIAWFASRKLGSA